uniref:hypothetical protein n=1 Tax=Proteus mirabilis TaxID=584 RepID=UPI001ADD8385
SLNNSFTGIHCLKNSIILLLQLMIAHADFFAWVFWLLSKTDYTGYYTKKNKIYQKMLILLR